MSSHSVFSALVIWVWASDPLEFKMVDFAEIHYRYARRYDLAKFKGYMKTILKNFKNQTQQFERKDENIPWTSKKKGKSKGWQLLYDLLMDERSRRKLDGMTLEEIHASNPNFERYPINDFKKYYREMNKLTGECVGYLLVHSRS